MSLRQIYKRIHLFFIFPLTHQLFIFPNSCDDDVDDDGSLCRSKLVRERGIKMKKAGRVCVLFISVCKWHILSQTSLGIRDLT